MSADLIAVVANTINLFFNALQFLIIARILLNWLAPHARGRITEFIVSTTEPVLGFFRRLPLRIGLVDLSPIVALIAIDFARTVLLKILSGI